MARRGIEGILANVDRYEVTNAKLTALWIKQRLYLPLAEACGYPTMQRSGKGIPNRGHNGAIEEESTKKKTP